MNNLCTVCSNTTFFKGTGEIENRFCRECGSVERHRALVEIIKRKNLAATMNSQTDELLPQPFEAVTFFTNDFV